MISVNAKGQGHQSTFVKNVFFNYIKGQLNPVG
jgi:hypothetical protein